MKMFKLSVITVCYNERDLILSTINSVLDQSYRNHIEYIIVDGCSKDGTLEIIESHSSDIDLIISEKDNGIYDAMNKGIKKASGEWIQFMNVGDTYASNDVLEKIFKDKHYSSEILYGKSSRVTKDGNIFPVLTESHEMLLNGPTFRHGACFIKSKYHKSNLFKVERADLGYALDYKFLYDSLIKGYKFEGVKYFILNYLEDGVSSNKYKSLIYNMRITGEKNFKVFNLIKLIKNVIKIYIRDSIFGKPIKAIKYFFVNWFFCKFTKSIPSWTFRKFLYRLSGMKIGKNTIINQGFEYYSPDRLCIGDSSHINRNCFIDARGYCNIGSNTSISHEVLILTGTHDINSENFAEIHKSVEIGDYVWIGARATILPGVSIGKGAVVAAGALVTKDIKDFEIVAGVPAKVMGTRQENLNYSCDWGIPFV